MNDTKIDVEGLRAKAEGASRKARELTRWIKPADDREVLNDAADAIDALLDRIAELEGALRPFVEILDVSEANAVKDKRDPLSVPDTFDVLAFRDVPGLKLGAFRRARTILSGAQS